MKKIILYMCLPLLACAIYSCSEPEEAIRRKFEVILKDDLAAIIDSVAADALLKTPYYDEVEYKTYDEGDYIRLAVVDFYFLKDVHMKVARKYRYHKKMGLWERYYNVYEAFTPKTNETTETTEN